MLRLNREGRRVVAGAFSWLLLLGFAVMAAQGTNDG